MQHRMEHNGDLSVAGVLLTITLTAISWFLNLLQYTDAMVLLVLHLVQIVAASGAILVAAITIHPPLKRKISNWFKS